MTVVPYSTDSRLGARGVEFFKDTKNLDTQYIGDFVCDLFNLELHCLLKGSLRQPLRYCADMVGSFWAHLPQAFMTSFGKSLDQWFHVGDSPYELLLAWCCRAQ